MPLFTCPPLNLLKLIHTWLKEWCLRVNTPKAEHSSPSFSLVVNSCIIDHFIKETDDNIITISSLSTSISCKVKVNRMSPAIKVGNQTMLILNPSTQTVQHINIPVSRDQLCTINWVPINQPVTKLRKYLSFIQINPPLPNTPLLCVMTHCAPLPPLKACLPTQNRLKEYLHLSKSLWLSN